MNDTAQYWLHLRGYLSLQKEHILVIRMLSSIYITICSMFTLVVLCRLCLYCVCYNLHTISSLNIDVCLVCVE